MDIPVTWNILLHHTSCIAEGHDACDIQITRYGCERHYWHVCLYIRKSITLQRSSLIDVLSCAAPSSGVLRVV